MQGGNGLDCAIYARVSTDKQGESVDHQVSLLRELADTRGEDWRVRDDCVYEDEGVSATKYSIWSRPAMRRLLFDAERGKFGVVLFKGISRLARNTHEALDVLERLQSKGLRVVSYEENYDSDVENSNFLFTMHAAIAEYEAEKISIRVRLGNKEKAKSGRFTGGTPPLGYRVGASGRLEVDEAWAGVVQKVFAWYVKEGVGPGKIADRLNRERIPTKAGGAWYASGVARILKNEVYTGTLLYNRRQDKSVRDYDSDVPGKKKEVRTANPRTAWVVVEDAHPALVSNADFAAATEQRTRRRLRQPAGPRAYHLLTGVLRCGRCGRSMTCQKRRQGGREYRYYICRTYHERGRAACSQPSLPADTVERLVIDRLRKHVEVGGTACGDEAGVTLLAALWDEEAAQVFASAKRWERWRRRLLQRLVEKIVADGRGLRVVYSFAFPQIDGDV